MDNIELNCCKWERSKNFFREQLISSHAKSIYFAPLGSVMVGEVQTADTSELGLDYRLSRKKSKTQSTMS